MAATAAAGIASLSSINSPVKCLRSKNSSIDPLMAISSNRMLASVSQSYLVEPLSISAIVPHKLWVPRTSAAVAQEEVVVVADEVDDGLVEEKVEEEEEEKEGEVLEEGGEVVAQEDTESSASTKLYFGNLPYSVDSAQLAGLIQDYGSAELIEVFM